MVNEMNLRGPVSRRTRSKEAEFYRQLHNEYKKKKVEEKSASKTESAGSDGVKKGNSCGSSRKNSSRKVSGFSDDGSGDSEKDFLDFLDTDRRYEMLLSCISDNAGVRTNFLKGDVSSSGAGYVGNDNDINIDKACESNNGNLWPEANLMCECDDGDNEGGVGDENDGQNNFETSNDSTVNVRFETKECVIISDGENDGRVNSCQTSENDTGNLKLKLLEKHANISDGSAGDDKDDVSFHETSGGDTNNLQRKFHKASDGNWRDDANGDSKDHDAEVCEISDDCVEDLDRDKRSKVKREVNTSMKRKSESSKKKSGDKCVKDVCNVQPTRRKHIRAPRTTRYVAKILADFKSENSEIPCEETKQPDNKSSIPQKFAFGIEESNPPKKSKEEEELDELWHEMDIELCKVVTENTMQVNVKRRSESSKKKSGDKYVKDVCNAQPTRRKHIRAPRTTRDVANILADFISENSEIPYEEKKQPDNKSSLPQKFTFGIEESNPPEKSKEEEELDELWHEMDIELCEVVTENTMQVDDAIDDVSEVKLNRDALCHRGDHYFILDEEIGLKCKYCFFVTVEIKDYTVPFHENYFGKSGRRGSFNVEQNSLEDSHYHDMTYNSVSTRDPNLLKQGTVWDIIPGIDDGMHQHQKEGFEFLWRNIAGDIVIEKLKEGSGCVISHAPGTGKTRLTIAFLQTYLKQYPSCKAVIIAPSGMLPTWEAEFQKWKIDVPFYNLNSTELSWKENISARKSASKGNSVKKEKLTRMVTLCSWTKDRSILGMSYRLFQELIGAVSNSNHKDDVAGKIRKILLEHTGLIVLDEGHTARNDDSLIWQALSKVRTEKRIILSGTPFQNNFDELYNILWLVRPKFAEKIPYKRHKLSKRRGSKKNEAREVWGSLTEQISREKDESLKAQTLAQLKKVIGPFVHIHKGSILQEKLPGLRESLIVLEPCKLQKTLLVNADKIDQSSFGKEHMISVLSVHPSLLLDIGLDLEKFGQNVDGLERNLRQLRLNPEVGTKTKFLMAFIRLCQAVNERVLVFSQYIHPLEFIIEQLKTQFRWSEGREILSIHGKLDVEKRQQLIKNFNDPKSVAKVLLASTRACSEGINLVGASRVVLLDVVWNPSVERQAISRAYRLGQERMVHIYHLITSGTMEEEKYCRQAEKDRMSNLLFSAEDKAYDPQKTPSDLPDGKRDKILQHMIDHEKLKSMFMKIIHQPKCTNLIESFGFLE